ncbi:GTPase HflX [Anatilimnocola aggregata]|uniref:GTPase HflX n=1 Tax=Anatilimnocola aggregata TaxID=2528021 RepID=A0A517YL46_9BACT|nr:GTPase HflX [Anatilimnocola aggregata]QDU30942.1 GTPase HflX [Anatilimnocola aggregata]
MQSLDRASGVAREKAILVRVVLQSESLNEQPLAELTGLAETAGAKIVGEMTQRRETPDMTTYLGRGKVGELKALAANLDADVAIFDNDLNPAQIRNLEQALGIKVLDRTELILDIFATNARSSESRLAVELAQLEYSLPRLKRMWTHLSRIKAGIGMRGPGEKQLEVDRRLVEKRIHDLREELGGIERRKERLVASRHDRLTVSLVGYTNAGKSTLMNTLTGAGVLAADKLFATLDTRTRRWQLDNWGPVLLSDTVGFIRDLPHGLVHSFKATLEEARQADLLLHVADASNPEVFDQISAVYKVLQELHIEEKDTVLVLNKIDRVHDRSDLARIFARYPNAVSISASSGEGLRNLQHAVSEALSRSFADLDIEASASDGRLFAFLAAHGEILERSYTEDDRVIIHCRLPQRHLGGIRQEGVTIQPHQNLVPAETTEFLGLIAGDDAIEEVA